MCFAVAVEHEYNKQNNSTDDSDTDNGADSCSDQRDEEKMFDVEKSQGICVTICMYDNDDDNLSAAVDFHVGNVESNCEQFEKFENEADSDKESQMTTSESHSKVIQQSN